MPDARGILRVIHFSAPERENRDVDALLFLERPGVVIEFQQPLLQSFRRKSSLKAYRCKLLMPRLVGLVVIGLRKISSGSSTVFLVASTRRLPATKVKARSRTSRRKISGVFVHDPTARAPLADRGAVEETVVGRQIEQPGARPAFAKRQVALENRLPP